jgi:hypothetical protein
VIASLHRYATCAVMLEALQHEGDEAFRRLDEELDERKNWVRTYRAIVDRNGPDRRLRNIWKGSGQPLAQPRRQRGIKSGVSLYHNRDLQGSSHAVTMAHSWRTCSS